MIGVELSQEGCEAFFKENNLSPTMTTAGPFQVFTAGKIKIFCGDFFQFGTSVLGTIGAIYDRAALIALPPDLRIKYAAHVTDLVKASRQPGNFHFLQILYERSPHDTEGPPFSVTSEQLQLYYRDTFDIQLLKKEEVDPDRFDKKTHQSVYRLSLRVQAAVSG